MESLPESLELSRYVPCRKEKCRQSCPALPHQTGKIGKRKEAQEKGGSRGRRGGRRRKIYSKQTQE
jgi:hypothetical protein